MKQLLLTLLLMPSFAFAQNTPPPFAPVAQSVLVSAPNGSSSSSTGIPGAGFGAVLQVYDAGTVPIAWVSSNVPGGATATATSNVISPGGTAYFFVGTGVFDVAAYGIGGTANVYFQLGNGGYTVNTNQSYPLISGSFTLNDCVKVGTASPVTFVDAGACGSSAFSSITSGTNTTAAMVVGSGATLSVNSTTAATSGANSNSPITTISGNYWNGTASAQDIWTIQDVLGTGTNPSASLTFSHSGSSGNDVIVVPELSTVGNGYLSSHGSIYDWNSGPPTGGIVSQTVTSATSSTNYNSPYFQALGTYWNGTASANDIWTIQDILGTGSNPTTTLRFSQSGSTGFGAVSVPQLIDAGLTAGTSPVCPNGTGGALTTSGCVSGAASSITPGTTTVSGATAPCLIDNSTGTTMGCLAETGTGNAVLSTSPTFTTPILTGYATASLPTCNAGTEGSLAYTTDGTPAFTFCNGTSWVNNGGTTFTMAGTGCTPTAPTGDATGGSFTLAAGPCTAVTITFNGAVGMTAQHMWVCNVNDQTLQAAGTWFGAWGQSSSTTTTATIPIPAAAGSTDVITFDCQPH